MLSLQMLPARHGDCLWLEWGADPVRRILIDGGTSGTWKNVRTKILDLDPGDREFELLIISHVDADHIAGILAMLEKDDTGVSFKEIWFNGWKQLLPVGVEIQGGVQGERLTALLAPLKDRWNSRFSDRRACVPDDGILQEFDFAGLSLTVLSPRWNELDRLRPVWEKAVRKAGLEPGRPAEPPPADLPDNIERMGPGDPDVATLADVETDDDTSRPNGSSIAVLAEYEGQRLLLAADAFPEVLGAALDALPPEKRTLAAFKLPHHGSRANVTKDLLRKMTCGHYLVSTSGAYFKHPDYEAISRVIRYGGSHPHLYFNYRSKHNAIWDRSGLKARYRYEATYPGAGEEGVRMDFGGGTP